jgi:hypothetical protein
VLISQLFSFQILIDDHHKFLELTLLDPRAPTAHRSLKCASFHLGDARQSPGQMMWGTFPNTVMASRRLLTRQFQSNKPTISLQFLIM